MEPSMRFQIVTLPGPPVITRSPATTTLKIRLPADHEVKDIFGAGLVQLSPAGLVVDGRTYPIVDDVIVLLDPAQYPPSVRARLSGGGAAAVSIDSYAPDIQDHYSKFWEEWSGLLPYYEQEFQGYFDLAKLLGKEPVRSDVTMPIDEHLIVELYSK